MAKGLPYSLANANLSGLSGGGSSAAAGVIYTLENETITATSISPDIGIGSLVINVFPTGDILFKGAIGYFLIDSNTSSAPAYATFGVGTLAASGSDLLGDASNILEIPTGDAGYSSRAVNTTARDFDNTSGTLSIFLNALIGATFSTGTSSLDFKVSGKLLLDYSTLA